MNAFANSLLTVILSWVKGAAKAFFDLFSKERSGDFFTWLGDYWLFAAIVLCLLGMAADLMVWMIRYKPFARVKRPRALRKNEMLDPDDFREGYDDRMDLGFAKDPVPRPEPVKEMPVQPVKEIPVQPVYSAEPAAAPEYSAAPAEPFPGSVYAPEEAPRRRRTDRYREERGAAGIMLDRLKRTLVDGDASPEETNRNSPDDHYYEPVYPQGDASEWQKWNGEQK